MKKSSKSTKNNKNAAQQKQMLIVVAIFALIGVAALGISRAQHGAGTAATGNATIGAVPECVSGTWVNHINIHSNTSRLGEVDVYETLNATQVIKIANQLSLSLTTNTTFNSTPAAGVTDDVLYATPYSATPIGSTTATPGNEVLARSDTYTNPCLPPPAPSGKGRHGL